MERGLAEVGRAEIEVAILFAEIEFARNLELVLCLVRCRQRKQELSQADDVLPQRAVGLKTCAQR